MAKQKRSRQTWWPLYALVLMMAGLLFLVHRLAPSPGWRIFLDVGIVVLGYGLMALWLETHPNALQHRPSAEANNQAVKSPESEIPSPLSDHVRPQLYTGSDRGIIYGEAEHQTDNLRSNGNHHPASITSYPP